MLLLAERGHDEFVTRFQQTSPPVMAKGVEDTAFYRYLRLLALNEVGGDPARFGLSVDAFHAANASAPALPRGLLVTQTHDTKRSGDVRARIGALPAMAEEWAAHVRGWLDASARRARPDATERYLVLQTLAGAWPIEPERLEAYVEKALREAKLHTSWVDARRGLRGGGRARYARGLRRRARPARTSSPFAERVAGEGGARRSASCCSSSPCPGVPDVYQGDELEALCLVDPDNRRPVDWEARRAALAAPARGRGAARLRRAQARPHPPRAGPARAPPGGFAGGYEPVAAGPGVCAYLRGGEVLAVVPVRGWEGARLAVARPLALGARRARRARAGGGRERGRAQRRMAGGAARACVSSSAAGAVDARGTRRPTKPAAATITAMHSPESSRWPAAVVSDSCSRPTTPPAISPPARPAHAASRRAPARSAPNAQPRKAPAAIMPTAVLAVSVPSAEKVRPA